MGLGQDILHERGLRPVRYSTDFGLALGDLPFLFVPDLLFEHFLETLLLLSLHFTFVSKIMHIVDTLHKILLAADRLAVHA